MAHEHDTDLAAVRDFYWRAPSSSNSAMTLVHVNARAAHFAALRCPDLGESPGHDEGTGRYDRFETAGSRSSAQARRLARVFQFLLQGEPFHGAAGRIGSGD